MTQLTFNIRDAAPADEIKSALANFAKDWPMLGPVNAEGEWILWSDTKWMCGTVTPVRHDPVPSSLPVSDECSACVL